MKCGFTGCKAEAKWECRKLWPARVPVLHTCDRHKPDPEKRSEKLKALNLPFFYEVKPLAHA